MEKVSKEYEKFLNWCEEKWKRDFKMRKLLSKLTSDDVSFIEAEYENRLKADMVAMLTEIQLEIEEKKFLESSCSFMDKTEEKNYAVYTDDISNIIQQKIDALKEVVEDGKID